MPPDNPIGARVVVRRRLGERDGRPVYSDVIGELTAIDEGELRVRTASGDEVTIDRGDVVATRFVPPAPARRRPSVDRTAPDAGE